MVLADLNGTFVRPGAKKPPKVSPFNSLVMVVMLMRRNVTQGAAGAIFGCSQSNRHPASDLLRPVIGRVLASFVPDPVQVHRPRRNRPGRRLRVPGLGLECNP